MIHARHFLTSDLSSLSASEIAALAPICSEASATHNRLGPEVVQIEMVQ